MNPPNRIGGGLVDREKSIQFSFNGTKLEGLVGDTLASALIANNRHFVARSFKYHRPRGIFSAGSEEPNALVQLGCGGRLEPNTRATVVELFDGLEAASQNHLGSLEFDLLAINDWLSPFLTAGFYYKTFMWPKAFWERLYEPFIRAAAGLGKLSGESDPGQYGKGFLHCDILVIGAGPAGLAAARAGALAGASVIIADEDFLPGGRLNSESFQVNGKPGSTWAAETAQELNSLDNVRFMSRSTVYGAFDHGIYGILEHRTDHLPNSGNKPRQIIWRVYAKRSILCAGATERHIAFGNNDRPGIMLAGAARAYVNRWAAPPGRRITILTNNDSGWRSAIDFINKGIEVSAVIDTRDVPARAKIPGAIIAMGHHVTTTYGRKGLKSIRLDNGRWIPTDCMAVSGGWNPNVHLTCHQRGRPVWQDELAAFVPGTSLPSGMSVAGAANGNFSLGAIFQDGWFAATAALQTLGYAPPSCSAPRAEDESQAVAAFWQAPIHRGRAWVDLQNDVTTKDVRLAHQEGYRTVELLKRYTTLGMATDQGKTSNVSGIAVLAECGGRSISETGTTIFRPPYTPVPIGAFAGRSRGRQFRPTRLTPGHRWAEENGASFIEVGAWMRPQWFKRHGEEQWRDSINREALAVRKSVGICDVTTLGKIDIQGRDSAEFIDRVYCNNFVSLAVGKVRYGLMLREDGLAMDDGTTARLAENHFVMTTTTANALSVFRHLEFCRQCLWPGMEVHLVSATEQWAQFAVAGPNSRKLLQHVIDDIDISNSAFPFLACAQVRVCGGTPARLFRISYSGELAFEIAVPARYGESMLRELLAAGQPYDATIYGTEALGVLRIEKGHPAGPELNGQTTALQLGLGRMVSNKKDAIGNVLSQREALSREDGFVLMGFRPVDHSRLLCAGAHFVARGNDPITENDEGWLSSAAFSPSLGHSIGLGFIKRGSEREGEIVRAVDLVRDSEIEVEIVSPHFIDPQGERLRG